MNTNFYTNNKPTRQRFILLACLFCGIFVAYLDRVNVSVLAANAPFLLDMEIKGMPVRIGLMMSVFLLAYGIANVILSPLGDYLGPRRAMMLCVILWILSQFMGATAIAFSIIIISRILLGIGEGLYYPLQSVFVKNWFPKKERGKANAAWVVGQSVAPALAIPIFSYIIATYGWHSSFYLCSILGLLPLWLLWKHTADTPDQHLKINEMELKYIENDQDNNSHKENDVSLSLWQRIAPFVTNYRYWLLTFWLVCSLCMYWGLVSWLPTYLKISRGFSWSAMGWLASLPFVLSIFSKILSGWLIDRTGRSAPILMIAMLCAGTCIYLGVDLENKYASAIFLACAVAFCTMGSPVVWTLLQGLVDAKSISTAAGTLNGVANGLSSLSPSLIGLFILLSGGYHGGLLALVIISIAGTITGFILTIQKY